MPNTSPKRIHISRSIFGSESLTSEDIRIGLLQGYQNGRTKEMYRGCRLQLVHALLKSALLMIAKERIAVATKMLILR